LAATDSNTTQRSTVYGTISTLPDTWGNQMEVYGKLFPEKAIAKRFEMYEIISLVFQKFADWSPPLPWKWNSIL